MERANMRYHRQLKQRVFTGMMRISVTVFLSVCLSQCSSTRNVDWHFTIPDNYQGFLVIRYECPGGKPLQIIDGKIFVEFSNNGTFCAKDKFISTRGEDFVQTKSGQPVKTVGSPRNRQGYAFYGGDTMSVGGGAGDPEYTFSIYWVGDLQRLAAAPNDAMYPDDLQQFLHDRFGVPIPPKVP
jgi:hypothetical protein